METYTKQAIRMLGRKRLVRIAIETLQQQLRYLDAELLTCRAVPSDDGIEESRHAKLLSKKEDAAFRLRALCEERERVERGYAVLTPYQQDLLDAFFVGREQDCVEQLSERHYRERSALYRDRKKALEIFTLAVFGSLDD